MTVLGSRSGASLADVIVMPVTRVLPMEGETTNPEGLASLAESRFKYFAWVLSIALATPSEPGLLDEEAITGSPGWVTSLCAYALLTVNSSRRPSSLANFKVDFCIRLKGGEIAFLGSVWERQGKSIPDGERHV